MCSGSRKNTRSHDECAIITTMELLLNARNDESSTLYTTRFCRLHISRMTTQRKALSSRTPHHQHSYASQPDLFTPAVVTTESDRWDHENKNADRWEYLEEYVRKMTSNRWEYEKSNSGEKTTRVTETGEKTDIISDRWEHCDSNAVTWGDYKSHSHRWTFVTATLRKLRQ